MENWRGVIGKPILGLLTFGSNTFFNDMGHFYDFGTSRPACHNPFLDISRPCSIEIMYPREWRIAIPASLMQVDKSDCIHFEVVIKLAVGAASPGRLR